MVQRLLLEAATGRFQRLIVSAIPAFGGTIREVVSIVRELLDLGITIIPAQSDGECIDPGMAKVLWLVESWCGEMARKRRSAAIKQGQNRVRAKGKRVGRPKRIFDREEVVRLRDAERQSWSQIAQALGIGAGTARRAYQQTAPSPGPAKNMREVA
jgi:DNA invertase Pin-like site-specific DNA recombinase